MRHFFNKQELSRWWWTLHLFLSLLWLCCRLYFWNHWFAVLWAVQWVAVCILWFLFRFYGKTLFKSSRLAGFLDGIMTTLLLPVAFFVASGACIDPVITMPALLFFVTFLVSGPCATEVRSRRSRATT